MSKFSKWFVIGLVILVITVFVLLVINMQLPDGWKLGSEELLVLAGAVLSLSFTYLPTWRAEFAALSAEQKVYINLGLATLLAIFMFIGTCTTWLPIPGVVCTQTGLKTLLLYIFLAGGGNQVVYIASPQPADVIAAKTMRGDTTSG